MVGAWWDGELGGAVFDGQHATSCDPKITMVSRSKAEDILYTTPFVTFSIQTLEYDSRIFERCICVTIYSSESYIFARWGFGV